MAASAFQKGDRVYDVKILDMVSTGNGFEYAFQCKCGKRGKAPAYRIRRRKCKLCAGYTINQCLYQVLLTYKTSASKRHIDFSLTEEEFSALIFSDCYYCGSRPGNAKKRYKTLMSYNGIDRVNNTQGYTMLNCVTCCKRCNYGKSNLSKKEFLDWIKRVYEHSVKGNENK